MSDYEFRSYRPGDEFGIVDLIAQSTRWPQNVSYWKWLNLQNPAGASLIEVVERNRQIIAHYAVLRMNLQMDGNPISGGFASQAVIHTSYRNLRNLLNMTDQTWDRCRTENLQFVYGFPNEKIWSLNRKLMGWYSICDFKSLSLPLQHFNPTSSLPDDPVIVKREFSFSENYRTFFETSQRMLAGKITLIKSVDWMNWKFFLNPQQHYIVFGVYRRSMVCGYMILKLYRKDESVSGDIIDLLVLDHDETLVRLLLQTAREFFKWAQVQRVSTWILKNHFYYDLFTSLGFEETDPEIHFGLKPIHNRIPESVFQPDHWHMTMADSDVF